jgi:hypothetical protein
MGASGIVPSAIFLSLVEASVAHTLILEYLVFMGESMIPAFWMEEALRLQFS